MMNELIDFLNLRIKECESSAEDYIQEYSNPEAADRASAKAEAFQEVLNYLNNKGE